MQERADYGLQVEGLDVTSNQNFSTPAGIFYSIPRLNIKLKLSLFTPDQYQLKKDDECISTHVSASSQYIQTPYAQTSVIQTRAEMGKSRGVLIQCTAITLAKEGYRRPVTSATMSCKARLNRFVH